MTHRSPPDLAALVADLAVGGAETVWLAGSYARGDAGPYSDLDLGVITSEAKLRPRGYRLYQGVLASIVWTTAARTRASFFDPAQLGSAVPGWRGAVLLHDPAATGQALKEDANAWSWSGVERQCDRWVAAQLAQLAAVNQCQTRRVPRCASTGSQRTTR